MQAETPQAETATESLDNFLDNCEKSVEVDKYVDGLKNVRGDLIRYYQRRFITSPDFEVVASGTKTPYDWVATVKFKILETGEEISQTVTQKRKKASQNSAAREALRILMRKVPREKLNGPKPRPAAGATGSAVSKEVPCGGEELKKYVDALLVNNGNVRGLLQRYVQKKVITTPEFRTKQAAPPPGTRWLVECEVKYKDSTIIGSGEDSKKKRASAQACAQLVKMLADQVPDEELAMAAQNKAKQRSRKRKKPEGEDGDGGTDAVKKEDDGAATPDEEFMANVICEKGGDETHEDVIKFVDNQSSLTTYSRLFGYLMSKKFLDMMEHEAVGQWLLCLSRNRTKFSAGQQRAYVNTLGRLGLKKRFEEVLRGGVELASPPAKKVKTEETEA